MKPFWAHFGWILDAFSIRNRSLGAQSRPKWLPGGLWNTASIFIDFWALFQIAPAAEGDADPTPVDDLWPRGETTDSGENPAGSRVPALVARMGLGSLSIGSFASYENTSSLVYFADLLRSVGGSMIPNAAGTALEDENAARRILRATPPAAGPPRDGNF